MKRNLIFTFLIFIFSLIAQGWAYEGVDISQAEDLLASAAAPLANLEGEPSATVHGCVNALTGDFYEAQVDLVLPGSDPFILERFYCSSDHQNGLLYHGWNHNLGGSLSERHSSRHHYGVTKGYAGGEIVYKGKDRENCLDVDPEILQKGIVNNSTGMINARTNIKNNLLVMEGNRAYLMTGSGARHDYFLVSKANEFENYSLFYHRLTHKPNGNKVAYNYSRGKIYGAGLLDGEDNLLHLLAFHNPTDKELKKHHKNSTHPVVSIDVPDEYKSPLDFKKKKGKAETIVRDGLNHQTIYEYALEDHRLRNIKRYKGAGPYSLYSEEKLYWGAPGTSDDSHLISRTLQDETGQPVFCRHYIYDEKGNILEDRLYGNITGKNTQPVALKDETPLENGCECQKKTSTYSKGRFNLATSVKEAGSEIQFRYHDSTDLLQAKLTVFDGSIQLREFFEYDKKAALTSHIIDDGCHEDPQNLTGVTERKIKRIENNGVGLPLVIEEFYLEGSRTILFKKTVNHYNPIGQLVQQDLYDADNAFAYSLYWEYDSQGHVIYETNALGHVIRRSYDANGNLLSEQGPRPDQLVRFTYDFMNRLTLQEVILPSGESLKTSHQYDIMGHKIATRDIYGNETRYEVDPFGRVIQMTLPPVEDENGQWVNPFIKYAYDVMGNVIAVTDSKGHTTTTAYTILGRPYLKTTPDGSIETCEYSLKGELVKAVDKNGTATVYTYDGLSRPIQCTLYDRQGKLLRQTNKTYNAFHLLSETDAAGLTTTYTYDAAGRLTQKERAGQKTLYFYDALHREVEVHEYYGLGPSDFIVKTKRYDLLNRVIEKSELAASGLVQSLVEYNYDEAGNCIEVKTYNQAGASCHRTQYNIFKELYLILDALQNATVISPQYHYRHQKGLHVPYSETTDPLGNKNLHIYDTHHRLCESQRLSSKGKLLQKQEQVFDLNGNLIRNTDTVIGRKSAPIVTAYTYDAMNRLAMTTEAAGAPEQKQTWWFYFPSGQLKQKLKPDGVSLNYDYDPLGRLSSLTSSDKNLSYRTIYNENDQPTLIEDLKNNFQNRREYNEQGFLIYERLGHGFEMRMSYDLMGRITSLTYPDNSYVEYLYQGNRLFEVKRFSALDEELYSHTYLEVDLSGNPLSIQKPGGCGTSYYEYDLLNRPLAINTSFWKEQITQYNAGGCLTMLSFEDVLGTCDCQYTYDECDQLLSESGMVQQRFTYDSIYNQTTKNGGVQTFNALHQLLQDTQASYEYNSNGLLISKQQKNGTTDYGYDALDRLSWVLNGQHLVRYVYDSDNRRLFKNLFNWDEAQKKWIRYDFYRYLYLGQNEIGTINSEGVLIECRILGLTQGAEVGGAIAHEIKGQITVPVHNHQGHVVTLLDLKTGQPQETYRTSAFGLEQLYDSNGEYLDVPSSPWRFSSKRHDPESGFVYFGERYYDPGIGRWLTPDPLGIADGPNPYAYVKNNPLNSIDPTGLFCVTLMTNTSQMNEGSLGEAQFQSNRQSASSFGFNSFCQSISSAFTTMANSINWDRINNAFSLEDREELLDPCGLTLEDLNEGYHRLEAILFANPADMSLVGIPFGPGGAVQTAPNSAKSILSKQASSQFIAKGGGARGAESVNAGVNLNRKLSRLEAYQNAVKTRVLPDGRIRYYDTEKMSQTIGPSRGACNVVEWTPKTGSVRGWYECYDHFGNVNRVHPKNINGQTISSPHYPPIGKELIQ